VEAEVVSLELRPSEQGAVRRIAVMRAAGGMLRVFMRDDKPSVGARVWVEIDGECEMVEGNNH
jgi:hypothetical protein